MANKNRLVITITLILGVFAQSCFSMSCQNSESCLASINELKELAEKKAPEAQLLMGLLYQRGTYLPKEPEKSFLWYKRAALKHRDLSLAQHLVGRAYLFGDGVEPNRLRAEKYLKRSAKAGLVDSQRLLGHEYSTGLRLELDRKLARFWLSKASKQNDYQSTVKLAELLAASDNFSDQEEAKKLMHASSNMQRHNKEIIQMFDVGPELISSTIKLSKLWLDGKIEKKSLCANSRDEGERCQNFFSVNNFTRVTRSGF